MKHLGLFEGIGGFSLAAHWMGWQTVAWCEWNPFCQAILRHHIPEAKEHHDIKETDFTQYEGNIDILTGGFPCQPFSAAGKQRGTEDDRHLWPHMLRAIGEAKPRYIVAENVAGLFGILEPTSISEVERQAVELFCADESQPVTTTVDRVQRRVIATIIEQIIQIGYVLPTLEDGTPIILCLPACAVNAPHRRDRVWFVAFRNDIVSNTRSDGWKQRGQFCERKEKITPIGSSIFQQFERSSKKWTITNTSRQRCHHRRNNWQKRPIQTNKRLAKENQPKRNGRLSRLGQIGATNPHPTRQPSTASPIRKPRQAKQRQPRRMGCQSSPRLVANDSCIRGREIHRHLQRQEPNGYRTHPHHERTDWTNWPTQAPICTGNDGLSAQLDTSTLLEGKPITFPKWRQESIKGGGNAIVPQVCLEIFKAIEAHAIATNS